jgi:Uncharacterized conserved protein
LQPHLVHSFTHAALSPDPDLAVAALMIARVEYPKLDAGPYLDQLDALRARGAPARRVGGRRARRRAGAGGSRSVRPGHGLERLPVRGAAIQRQRAQYEDPRNSFLNQVLERRTGIPVTLALVYLEVARRAGLYVEGINFPGRFLLRCPARRGLPYSEDLIIDAFRGGALLTRDACRDLLRTGTGDESTPGDDDGLFESRLFVHATKPQILARMLANLKRLYVRMHSFPQARDITDLLVAVNPSAIRRAARPRPARLSHEGFFRRAPRSSTVPGAVVVGPPRR